MTKVFVSNTPSRLPVKRLLHVGAAVLVFAILVILAVSYINKPKTKTLPVATAEQSATNSDNHGDPQQAVTSLKEALPKASTNQEKINLYNQLAQSASSAGQLQTAVNYYNLKHQLDPQSAGADASVMASLYERLGQNSNAITWDQTSISYLHTQKQSGFVTAEIAEINTDIQNLKGSQ